HLPQCETRNGPGTRLDTFVRLVIPPRYWRLRGKSRCQGVSIMKRGTVCVLLMCLTAAGGCMSQPRVVSMDRETGTGVVAIPNGSDAWPFYYRREALALIEKQVGPNYKILNEGDVPTGTRTENQQQTTTDQLRNGNQAAQ